MKEIKRKKLSAAIIAVVGTSVIALGSAQAQQTQKIEKIEVTGSNIKRLDSETAEPIIVISREDISSSGKGTLAEYLQTMTVDGQGSIPTSFGNGFAAGSTAIALRGLGANATLVLLNGRRLAPYPRPDDFQKQLSDLSTIPLEAVERIEILKDGASAIYGSDALAGVVNIILRKDFTGGIVKAEGGTSRYSDGDRLKGALTIGGGDLARDRWNGFLNLEVSKSDEIAFRDRDRKWIGKGDTRPWGYDPLASQWTPGYQVSATGTPSASPAGYIRNPSTGAYTTISPCTSVPTTIQPRIAGDLGCSYDIGQYRDFQPKIQTMSLFGRGTFAINANLEAYGEFSYGKNKSEFDVSPLTATPTVFGPYGVRNFSTGVGVPEVQLAANHPDNPYGAPARFRYIFSEFGAQRRVYDADISRFLVGLKGSGWGWDFDTGYVHSESNLDLDYTVINTAALYDAFTNPNSTAFYRLGANQGLNTDAQRAALLVHATAKNTTKLDIVDFKGSKELMQLAGGGLALALGTEYRRTKVDAPSLGGTDTGAVGASYVASFGDEKVWAVYGEVLAPVTRQIELSAAVRHDKYDNFSSTTPKFAVKFTPIQQLALRASYAEGFRAPNGPESNPLSGAAASSGGVRDPIRCPLVNGTPTPLPGASAADCTGTTVAGIGSGNPDLKPEKSKNYNLGFIVEPVRNMSVALDWWKIKKKDEIGTSSFAASALRPDVIRADNPLPGIPNSGTLVAVFAPFQNATSSEVRGIDFDASFRWTMGDAGRMKADLRWTRTSSLKRVDPDGTVLEFAGTHGNCDVSNCIGTPKDKVNAVLSWDMGPFGLTGVANWRGSMKNIYEEGDSSCGSFFADGSDAPNGCRIPSFWTFDLSGRWNVTRQLQVYGSIQNLTDRVAPLDPTTYGGINYNPMDVSGAMGRYYTLGLKYTFK
jgi:iron complex outermembrane recepter protein